MKWCVRIGMSRAVLAAVLAGMAGSVYAGDPPAGKTVLWDGASKTLRITYANADGALGAVDGTFVLPSNLRSTWKVKVRDGVVSLAYNSGMALILR